MSQPHRSREKHFSTAGGRSRRVVLWSQLLWLLVACSPADNSRFIVVVNGCPEGEVAVGTPVQVSIVLGEEFMDSFLSPPAGSRILGVVVDQADNATVTDVQRVSDTEFSAVITPTAAGPVTVSFRGDSDSPNSLFGEEFTTVCSVTSAVHHMRLI